MSTAQPDILLEALDLTICPAPRAAAAVRELSFRIRRGRTLSILGASGCGKSLLAHAVLRLLPPGATATGQLIFLGRDLLRVPDDELRHMRGQHVGYVASNPREMFNPLDPVGPQVGQSLAVHHGLTDREALASAVEAMRRVGVSRPDELAQGHAHQHSSLDLARAALASAVVCSPALLVLDDPTRHLDDALDRDEMIDSIRRVRASSGCAVLLLTRDATVATELADRMDVMHDGRFAGASTAGNLARPGDGPFTVQTSRAFES
ncbi:MAG: ATP-binding cassette domain-containing protein [Planctomycetota bacterium]